MRRKSHIYYFTIHQSIWNMHTKYWNIFQNQNKSDSKFSYIQTA